jgi:hypothetical protein
MSFPAAFRGFPGAGLFAPALDAARPLDEAAFFLAWGFFFNAQFVLSEGVFFGAAAFAAGEACLTGFAEGGRALMVSQYPFKTPTSSKVLLRGLDYPSFSTIWLNHERQGAGRAGCRQDQGGSQGNLSREGL